MSYLYALFDWRLINLIAPFIGITVCVYLLMSKNTCTVQKSISTILALGVLSWLMLIWADWGSTIFEPSYQSALARVIMVFMMLIVAFVLHRATKRNRSLSIKTRILSAENELLKEQLNIMRGKTEPTQE
ncbi:hypothetical protein ACTXGL_09635 [Psychrobacter sp. T6-6]|uniref:hypothetical protein n=1 Tax=Psychrobacter sp. T6-6 TaxID=3457452 RepID=UPI003FD2EB28